MAASTASVTDDVIREIGEQVSLAMCERLPKWGGTAFDIASGVEMYKGHLQTFENLQDIRTNKDKSESYAERKVIGNSFEELDAYSRRRDGKIAYTTDELHRRLEDNPEDPLFKKYKELKKYARRDHQQTDVVEIRNGEVKMIQHKDYKDPGGAIDAFMKDIENDEFVVPQDKFQDTLDKIDARIAKGGEDVEKLKKIRGKLKPSAASSSEARRPQETVVTTAIDDASKRAAQNIKDGVIADMALFAVGGAAMEIREAWRNPVEMPVLERCQRLIQAVWQRFLAALKDRSAREIGSEAITAAAGILKNVYGMALAALTKIATVLRRLWMDFTAGRLKTPADVVSAALKAAFVVASAGVALAVETKLKPLLAGIPFGDILAALCAAVVAGVMIVIGNRAIEAVVLSLCRIFEGAAAARRRREEIETLCAAVLPQLIADRERLESLVNSHINQRQVLLGRTFADLRTAREGDDIDGFLEGLCQLNVAFGKNLPWRNMSEFDSVMLDPKALKL